MDKALNFHADALLICPCCGHDAHYVSCTHGMYDKQLGRRVPCSCRSMGVPWVCPACRTQGPHYCEVKQAPRKEAHAPNA